MRTPDLGARMTDFSYTAQHIADGRAAAEATDRSAVTSVEPRADQRLCGPPTVAAPTRS